MFRRTSHLVLGLALLLTPTLSAASADFDFQDAKGVNAIYFLLDSELEPIMGLASGITGKLSFDPAAPNATTGKIVVAANTIHFENERMTEKLFTEEWLDVQKHTEITFEFKEIKDVKSTDNVHKMSVVGDFTCRGVTKSISAPVQATFLKDRLADRLRGQKGDLLVLRSEFSISRKDFGIKPDMSTAIVADEIRVRVLIVGAHAKN